MVVIFSKEPAAYTFSCPKMETASRSESLIKNIIICYFIRHNTTVLVVTLSAMCKSLLVCNHCFCLIYIYLAFKFSEESLDLCFSTFKASHILQMCIIM